MASTSNDDIDVALNVIRRCIPDDLHAFESYITSQVLAFVEGDFDADLLQAITESVVDSLRGTIEGYRVLGRAATNKASAVALAFG